jgi:hypothetical protein
MCDEAKFPEVGTAARKTSSPSTLGWTTSGEVEAESASCTPPAWKYPFGCPYSKEVHGSEFLSGHDYRAVGMKWFESPISILTRITTVDSPRPPDHRDCVACCSSTLVEVTLARLNTGATTIHECQYHTMEPLRRETAITEIERHRRHQGQIPCRLHP